MAADWSPEIWNSWEKSGKAEYIKIVKSYIKDVDRTPLLSKTGKLTGISRALYELFVKGVRGNLRKESVVSTLCDLSSIHSDLPSIILDVACIIDSETCTETATDERNKFCFIVRETEKFLSDKLLKERLEIDTLQDVGTLKNKNFYTKFIKIKTKLYYKQRKFNLFREESEGYAKLIVELNQEISGKIDSKSILEIVKSLIGCFNLDPNRVLDIILESFESRPEQEDLFIPLVRSYMGDASIISEVLGFKLAGHADDPNGGPEGLYALTALLLQHQIISLDDIYQWLKPNDSVIWKECEREMRDAQEYARKLSLICTNKQPGEEEKEAKENVQERSGGGGGSSGWGSDAGNQKLQLGAALLRVGCWSGFSALAARLPDFRASSFPPAARALCRMLHVTVHPLYQQYCPIAPRIKSKPIQPLRNQLAVPQATTLEDLREVVVPALAVLGPALHTDPVLMYKVVRLCRAARGVPGDPLRLEVLSILDSAVLPALSYMDCNCCMAEEIYSLLKLYTYQFRYCLYARWKNEAPLRHASLLRRRADAQRRIKAIMKRVSKENVKPQGRLIGKLSHAAPGFFFDYVLLQIQIYDNLIGPVVESLKYLTSLSYDMLGYCLVEALGGGKRARVQPDGSSAAPWLQCLAAFGGSACKKYNMDLTALLQFVVNQLKAEKSLDLLILKEIVQKMAGIEAAEEMTADQLDAMSGGELLRAEAGYFCQVRNTKKSSQRLKEALGAGEEGLAAALCLLAAQQRHCCVYRSGGAEGAPRPHLKLVGRLIDQCQDTLVQFGAFLAAAHTHDEYATRLPRIEAMLQEFHIDADVAFFLARPALAWSISSRYEKLRHERGGVSKQQRYAEASAAAMAPVVSAVSTTLPFRVWEDISPEFYVTFWSLTMYDLSVPYAAYNREMERLRALATAAGAEGGTNTAKGRKEQERYHTLENKLKEECRKQQEYVDRVMHRLTQEKDSWFPSRSSKSAKNETITQFMQLCLFPRCIFTSMDALYCAHFLHTIHSLKTANFSTLLCYDRLFCDITYTVTCLTEGEAARYGRFLGAVLATAMRWHGERATFQKECANSPGFVTKFRVSNQFTEANDNVGYENYRHVCHKWHYKITKAMVVCLDSRDYVQIRNSLIVLIRILPHFPVLRKLSQIIERKIEKVREEEKNQRQDLFILATSYSGQLRNRSACMMEEADFHQAVSEAGVAAPVSHAPSHPPHAAPPNGDRVAEKELKKETSNKDRKSNSKVEETATRESKRDTSQPSRSSSGAGERRPAPGGSDWEERRAPGKDERRKDRTPTERTYREESRYLEAVSPPGQTERGAEEMSSLSSTNSNGSHRAAISLDSQEREMKRRKLDENSTMKAGKEVREGSPTERRPRGTGKGGAGSGGRSARAPEDREARKERKLGRKRDRVDEALMEQKRRRGEQKDHQNGDQEEHHIIEKHHHKREKSPYRDRSPHERQETREKHRRTNDNKLRR